MAYIDYGRKRIGMGESFKQGEDIGADFEQIRDFYADKRGPRPRQESTIRPQMR